MAWLVDISQGIGAPRSRTLSEHGFEVLRWRPRHLAPRAEFASLRALQICAIRNRATVFVWPGEGKLENGVFAFKDAYRDLEPVLIDPMAARAIVAAHDRLSLGRRAKFEAIVAHRRESFARLVGEVLAQRLRARHP